MEVNATIPIPTPALPVPLPVLQAVAAHGRAAGACVILLRPDGAILWRDPQAAPFYDQYLLPALAMDGAAGAMLRAHLPAMAAGSVPCVWDEIPGVLLGAAPVIERRQTAAVMLIAAYDRAFEPGLHFQQICQRLGAGQRDIEHLAASLPTYDAGQLGAWTHLLMTALSDQMRTRILEGELNSLSTQLSNAYEELTLIEQISSGMRVNRGIADFFHQACLDVMQVICVRGMGFALRQDKTSCKPALFGEISLPPEDLQRLTDRLLSDLRQRQSWLLVNHIAEDHDFGWLAPVAGRLIAVPLLRGEQLLGCLFGLDKTTGEFDSVDGKLLTSIANESAIYLENAQLFGDLHDLMMGLLHSLTSAVDAKDAYTCGHSERVALLARHLAVRTGLCDAEVEQVYMAGLLHDVGKIGVPENVLQKNGRLTAEEFEIVKKHPLIGARILNDVKQLEDIVPGVLHHHERFDGRGYPAGLAGRDIPLIGRIICLADCFDAMTSSRTYRKALPLEVALAEIRRCSGTQFDPALAESFLQITPEQFRMLLRDHQRQAKKLLELQETLRAA